MTKKVTGKHLKKLIEGVLNEKFLPMDRKKSGKNQSYRDFASEFNSKFGFSLDSYKATEIEKLFNKDPQDKLTASDFQLEFFGICVIILHCNSECPSSNPISSSFLSRGRWVYIIRQKL